MNVKHSPGPWKVAEDFADSVYDADDCMVCKCLSHGLAVTEVNAHLIASAPDLLLACRDALCLLRSGNKIDCREHNDCVCLACRIESAIARAEGRA